MFFTELGREDFYYSIYYVLTGECPLLDFSIFRCRFSWILGSYISGADVHYHVSISGPTLGQGCMLFFITHLITETVPSKPYIHIT